MSTIKSLVIYYSLEGSTRVIAKAIAEATGADIVALRPAVEPTASGFARYLQYGWQQITHPRMRIAPLDIDIQAYDLIYVGTPVWNSQPAPAVQTLLRVTPLAGKLVALFCTHRGGPGRTLARMEIAAAGARILGRLDLVDVPGDSAGAGMRAAAWAKEIETKAISLRGAQLL